jgi:hypothetical protein
LVHSATFRYVYVNCCWNIIIHNILFQIQKDLEE